MRYSFLLVLVLLLPCSAAFSAETIHDQKEEKILAEVKPVLGNLKTMIAEKNYSEALKDAKELLKKTEYSLDPAHPVLDDVYSILSTLYYYKNDYDNAAYYMEKALSVEKAAMTEPEKIGKTIDLLSAIYSKLGKTEKISELKILKAVVFRPLFAQPIAENAAASESTTVKMDAKKITAPVSAQPEPATKIETKESLSEPPTAEASALPVAENMSASAKKVLWFYATLMLLLIAFGLMRKRKLSLEQAEEAALPEIRKQAPVSFSIARPEITLPEIKAVETKTEARREEIQAEPSKPVEKIDEKPQTAEEAIPTADERWKEYQQRFSERQARVILGIDEEASWDEIKDRYRELMKTYDIKNLDYYSAELKKTAEFRKEKIVQAFGILKSKQTFPKRTSASASKPELANV